MALDLELKAFVDDGSLEAWAERFPGDSEDLQFLHLYFTGERGACETDSESDRELRRLAVAMMERHPGIHTRRLHLARSWDVLHFVVSEDRRSGVASRGEPGSMALRGQRDFRPMVRATQGAPLRYLPAGDVGLVLEHLREVTPVDIDVRLCEATAPGTNLYRFSPEDVDEWAGRVRELLRDLIRFYAAVHERGEAVLSILD